MKSKTKDTALDVSDAIIAGFPLVYEYKEIQPTMNALAELMLALATRLDMEATLTSGCDINTKFQRQAELLGILGEKLRFAALFQFGQS